MEALAAAGLAGNVVQFIDFTYKLFNGAASIHNSRSGLQKGAQDLETVTQVLQKLCVELSRDDPAHSEGRNAVYQSGLQKLALECSKTANDLLSVLARLKVKESDSKWSSFRAALATVFKKADIEALEKSLDGYRMIMVMELHKMQGEGITNIFGSLNRLNHRSEQVSADISYQISRTKDEVRRAVEGLRQDLERRDALTQDPALLKPKQGLKVVPIDITPLSQLLIDCESTGARMMVSLAVLESLTFPRRDTRHSSIHEAHPKTYDSVYKKDIVNWLRSKELIYWISGKPGSGKSTLMKYIVDNKATRSNLRISMGGQDPIVASYFFWINGKPLQRSQEGLLQSLLYEILRQSPDLIQLALPDQWISLTALAHQRESSSYDWKHAELIAAFQRLADAGVTAAKMCIFIDGLDEYGGDHDQLINTIRHLVTMKIKMCIASRPWNVFKEAFGKTKSKLCMQDVNTPDIELYINDKLRDRLHDRSTVFRNFDADDILREIVQKSQGVFLWVYLVVQSLNEGLRNYDRLSQLRARVNAFPSDLEEFFNHIFRSMDAIYRAPIAHMFQVALQSSETLTPLAYWFLDEQEDDPNMALTMPVLGITEEDIHTRIEQMSVRINGRCKGLLEIHVTKTSTHSHNHDRDPKVDFLHRTVKDFLTTTNIRETLIDWQKQDFDASLAICRASLALIKSVATTYYTKVPLVSRAVQSVFESAQDLESKGIMAHTAYLDELERVNQHPISTQHPIVDTWDVRDGRFLKVAIEQNLTLFIKDRLRISPPRSKDVKLKYLSFSNTLEMTCVIVAYGPPLMLDEEAQNSLLLHFKGRTPEKILESLRQILSHTCFAPSEVGQFAWGLNNYLWENASPTDIDGLIHMNYERTREYVKGAGVCEKKIIEEEKKPVQRRRKEERLTQIAQLIEKEKTGRKQEKTQNPEVIVSDGLLVRKIWI